MLQNLTHDDSITTVRLKTRNVSAMTGRSVFLTRTISTITQITMFPRITLAMTATALKGTFCKLGIRAWIDAAGVESVSWALSEN